MRNAFVVLVSLCIGLVLGFIVPPSISQYTNITNISNTDKTKEETKSSVLVAKSAILPKNRTDIDEQDLYEHATEKKKNQSERAFIYINQKFRNPTRNKVIKLSHDKQMKDHPSHITPPAIWVTIHQTPCPIDFDSGHSRNSGNSANSVITAHSDKSANSALSGQSANSGVSAQSAKSASSAMPSHSANSVMSSQPLNNAMSPNPAKAATSTYLEKSAHLVNSALPANMAKTYFQGYDLPDNPQMSSYFKAPNIFRCNFDKIKPFKDSVQTQQHKNRMDERRDYFELLKPPLLRRPASRVNNKANYQALSNIPHNVKSQYLNNMQMHDQHQDEMRNKFGYDRPSMRHPVFRNKDMLHRPDSGSYANEYVREDEGRKTYDSNQEEDKLLNKFLKETLEEQMSINDKGTATDCTYRDCILQTTKQYPNKGIVVKPDCNCGRRVNLKKTDSFLGKDRSLREETKQKETATKSVEVNYEELLTDDSNSILKLDDDIIRPPNKNNETSSL